MQQKIDKVIINTALPEDRLKQNILDARKYCLTPISELPDWREGRTAAIVGGGPSLSKHLDQLRKENLTIACGSVHDYLMSNRVEPNYTLICDPDPLMAKYISRRGRKENTKYLIASQCSEEVFYVTEGRDRYIWDCLGPTEFNQEMFDAGRANAIPGGCTVGTRAILCAIGMGFKKLRLYGMDSCIDGEKHHSYEFHNPELESLGEITEIKIDHSDKTFQVAGYMMAQIFDFQEILKVYGETLQIEVIGDGVLAEIMRIGHVKAKQHLEKVN